MNSMLIPVCIGKIHRATVTEANLNYVGSITVDETLLKAAGIRPFQQVTITNLRNGMLWYTYAMVGPADQGGICLNGPPTHHFTPGDIIFILAYVQIEPAEYKTIEPLVVFVDGKNKITSIDRHTELKVEGTL